MPAPRAQREVIASPRKPAMMARATFIGSGVSALTMAMITAVRTPTS